MNHCQNTIDNLQNEKQAFEEEKLHSDQSIAQIALDFGFCDQSAFTQLFRKHMGLTPRQFRLRYANAVVR